MPIHDVGLDENGNYYFVMKYVDGETLEHIIKKLATAIRTITGVILVDVRWKFLWASCARSSFAHDQGNCPSRH